VGNFKFTEGHKLDNWLLNMRMKYQQVGGMLAGINMLNVGVGGGC